MKIKPVVLSFFLSLVFMAPLVSSGKPELFTIASSSTSVADQDEKVKLNIVLAANKLNNVEVKPGAIFSFNEVVGEGSAKNGFVEGRVLYRDYVAYEPGGGICQVSSTLFNAFLIAGCRIVERHRHYQPVTYVPIGLDATIKYGKKNLRIKNPYKHSLFIHAFMNDKSLVITIRSSTKLKYRYELVTEEEELTLPFSEKKEEIRDAISVYVYRIKYKGNKIIERFLLYKDYYPPVYIKE